MHVTDKQLTKVSSEVFDKLYPLLLLLPELDVAILTACHQEVCPVILIIMY